MNRRHFLGTSSLAVVAAALGELPLQARQDSPMFAPLKFDDIRRGVGYFTRQGGTIGWYVSKDGAVVVDSQYPATARMCLERLKQKSAHSIDVLFNTNYHRDHTAGNIVFRPVVRSIVSHENTPIWQKKAAIEAKREEEQAYPDTTFADAWTTKIGGETITAKYYGNAQTNTDIVVSFENANVVHVGGLAHIRFHASIDPHAGASIANWIKVLDTVLGEHSAATVYIFGHGLGDIVTGGRAELARFRDYLSALLEYTRRQMKAGKGKDEIVKTDVLPGFEDYISPTPQVTLAIVLSAAYDEVTAK